MSTDIPALTTQLWQTFQPYLPLLLSEAAKETGKRVPEAVGKLWNALRTRMTQKPAAQEALTDLARTPDDPDTQAAFRVQVKKLLAEDDAFAAQLAALLQAAGTHYEAHLEDDGAIAQGPGATAVGSRGVYIGGDANGNTIVTGDSNKVGR